MSSAATLPLLLKQLKLPTMLSHFEEQAEMAHRNLVKELSDAGASPEDVVKLNSYIVDLSSDKSKTLGQVKAKYFTHTNQPASTVVGVSALVMKPLLVEVEATAVIEA